MFEFLRNESSIFWRIVAVIGLILIFIVFYYSYDTIGTLVDHFIQKWEIEREVEIFSSWVRENYTSIFIFTFVWIYGTEAIKRKLATGKWRGE